MKQIFIFRKTYAAVILIGYLMAFSSAMAQQMPRRNALRETNNEFFKTEEARRIGNQVLGVSALYRWLAEEYRYDSKDE